MTLNLGIVLFPKYKKALMLCIKAFLYGHR